MATERNVRIVELEPERVRGTRLLYDYTTEGYYDPEITDGGFGIRFVKKSFDVPVRKSFSDILCDEWVADPVLFAAVSDGRGVGVIELCHEKWNNRVRITNLLVDNELRSMGIGSLLILSAVSHAKEIGARAIVLETQSCNLPAIEFYRAAGFSLCGCDLKCYSNSDVEKREVRLEFCRAIETPKEA